MQTVEETLFSTVSRTPIRQFSNEVTQTPTDTKWIAIKSATINRRLSKEPHDIIKELRVLSSVSHANIIVILGSQSDQTKMILRYWMPYIQYTLFDLISSSSFSPHPLLSFSTVCPIRSPREDRFTLLAKSIIYQILSALAYLHDPRRGIAHRDIKPCNILLTGEGLVQVIDFGIAWKGIDSGKEMDENDDLWPETEEKMYFEVATGPYRAPELLFGPLTYDASATDLWSLGATFAEFFTPLRLTHSDEDDEADDSDTSDDSVKPFIIPSTSTFRPADPTARWRRDSLFNADKGEIGLAWSIFKIRGTPNDDTWPTFRDLPDATKVTFVSVPAVDLTSLLPNLPPSTIPQAGASQATSHAPSRTMSSSPFDLLHRFLVYPQSDRIRAVDALRHPWFTADPVALLPPGYPLEHIDDGSILRSQVGCLWEGKTLGEWLRASLPHKSSLPGED